MTPAIRIDGLHKRFAGLQALRDVSFEVPDGGIVALIGPNGAGKTTCFNIIAGALHPTAGRVAAYGRPIVGLTPERIAQLGIARTFQLTRPFLGLSVLENAMVGALLRARRVRDARDEAEAVLRTLDMAEKAAWPAARLTLPDRKLLELARVLATRPRVLLLDEVMAGLRPAEADRIVAVLRGLSARGLTILLIEHVMRVVMRLAGYVVVLHHGEMIAAGPPQQVACDPRVVESYLGRRRVW